IHGSEKTGKRGMRIRPQFQLKKACSRDYFILYDLESRNLQEILAHIETNKGRMYTDSSYKGVQNILDKFELYIVSQGVSRSGFPKSFRYTYREVLNGSGQKGLSGENAVLKLHNQFDVECLDLKPSK
ncbi:hypothetical protein K2X30_15935, partial [bacterium]|nr:hypothetical protein [bacterium]